MIQESPPQEEQEQKPVRQKTEAVLPLSWLIGVLGATHIVGGSVDAFYLVAVGERSVGDFVFRHAVSTLRGNMAGGITLVAAFGHAQFARADRIQS
jgi:formate/nitrite transporter FocA (FNT family)